MTVEAEACQEALAEVVRDVLMVHRNEVIAELTGALRNDVVELSADKRLSALLDTSITENIISAMSFLEGHTSLNELDATSGALAHARLLAQRDVPLSALLRAYRHGQAHFLDLAMGWIEDDDATRQRGLMRQLVSQTSAFVDRVCDQVSQAYQEERDVWVTTHGGLRQRWIAQLRSGESSTLSEAERALNYSLSATHLGLQLWTPEGRAAGESRTALEEIRRILPTAVGAVNHPLVLPLDDREFHLWIPVRNTYTLNADAIAASVSEATRSVVRLTVGSPEWGVDGFRRTMDQAERVKTLLLASSLPAPAVTTYGMLGPVALMANDLDSLRRFVLRSLGDLAVDGEREETLRETLREFLGHNRSFAATAQAMLLHRNSVQYRVHRALELCQRDLNEPDVALDLQVALNAAQWLGRRVLRRS